MSGGNLVNTVASLVLAGGLSLHSQTAWADQLDDLLANMRRGTTVADPAKQADLVRAELVQGGKAYRSQITNLYLMQVKASVIDPEHQGGWPVRTWLMADKSYLQQHITEELKRMYGEKPEPILAYALVCPALFAKDSALVERLELYLKTKDPFLYQIEQKQVSWWRSYVQDTLGKGGS